MKNTKILPDKVLKVQTKLTLRLRKRLAKLSPETKRSLNAMGMLTMERTTAFLALALGDRKPRTVSEMITRLNMSPTNGTAYRALKVGVVTKLVKPAGKNKYQLVL